MPDETNFKAAGEQPPSTVEQQSPSVSQEHAPSTNVPETTDIPSANAPDPNALNPQNPNSAVKEGAKKPAAEAGEKKPAAKKEKPPALESKPFAEFINQDYLPALAANLKKQGLDDLDLKFVKQKIPVIGMANEPECWQVEGRWLGGNRRFNIYFFKEDIQGQRAFSHSQTAGKASTLEPFLIDERKVTLDLLVFGVFQRLTAQKWLALN